MQKWKFVSYENGRPVTRTELSKNEAVRAVEEAMLGRNPFQNEETGEPGTSEHRIPVAA